MKSLVGYEYTDDMRQQNIAEGRALMRYGAMCDKALMAGIKDLGYFGHHGYKVESYSGTVEIEYEGKRYLAIGHKPTGTPRSVKRQGRIEFVEIKVKDAE